MKVVIVNTLFPPISEGGAEKSVFIHAKNLVKKGLDVTIVTLDKKEGRYNLDEIDVIKIAIPNIYWPFSKKKRHFALKLLWHVIDMFNPFVFYKMIKILKAENPDILHSNNLSGFSTSVWLAAKTFDIPIVHTLRDYYLLCPKSIMFKNGRNCETQCLNCRILSSLKKISTSNINTVIGISGFILEKHKSFGYFRFTNEEVIRNSVESIGSISSEGKKTKKFPRFGFLGRIEDSKGIEAVLEVFDKNNYQFFVAGRGKKPYVDKLRRKYSNSEIYFIGFCKPAELFKKIDILIVPSLWHEPFGRVIIESLSYGKPVIATKSGGIPEIVSDEVGWLIDNDKIYEQLSSIIEKIRNDNSLVSTKSENIKKYINKFDPNITTSKYISLYRKVVEDINS